MTLNDFSIELIISDDIWKDFANVEENYLEKKLGERLSRFIKEKIYNLIENTFKDRFKLQKKQY